MLENIYILWLLLVFLLIVVIIVVWTTSFSVPLEFENNSLKWIYQNKRRRMYLWIFIVILILAISFWMFSMRETIDYQAPLSQPGIFLVAITILLVSNFFIIKSSGLVQNSDAHPMIYYTTIFLIFMTLISGIFCSLKQRAKTFPLEKHIKENYGA